MYINIYIPGSSKCVLFVPFHKKKLPKGINFTYLEDPGMNKWGNIQILEKRLCDFSRKKSVFVNRRRSSSSAFNSPPALGHFSPHREASETAISESSTPLKTNMVHLKITCFLKGRSSSKPPIFEFQPLVFVGVYHFFPLFKNHRFLFFSEKE